MCGGGTAQPPPFLPLAPNFSLPPIANRGVRGGWGMLQLQNGCREGRDGGGGVDMLAGEPKSTVSPSRSCRSPTVSGHGAPGEGMCGVCMVGGEK